MSSDCRRSSGAPTDVGNSSTGKTHSPKATIGRASGNQSLAGVSPRRGATAFWAPGSGLRFPAGSLAGGRVGREDRAGGGALALRFMPGSASSKNEG